MKKYLLLSLVLFTQLPQLTAQTPAIFMDGFFDDWHSSHTKYSDPEFDANSELDLREFSITNDSDNVYLRIKFSQVVNLQESQVQVLFDVDNNSSTGSAVKNMGVDLTYHFGHKLGYFNGNLVRQYNVGLISLPTHSSDEFEISFGRYETPNNVSLLFSSDTIRIALQTSNGNGDHLPDNGHIQYVLTKDYPAPAKPIVLEKEDTALLRISNWNILYDGPFETHKENTFTRTLKAIGADIWAFQEFFNSTASDVKTYMDNILPTGTANGWYTVKLDRDNVTVSRYPIVQSWMVLQTHNITASLIDLPEKFSKDILVINSHFRCCTANDQRQQEADALVAFLKDAQTTGGAIDMPRGTPFIILGDLNLVGHKQQLLTLLEGDIQDSITYGSDRLPDWDTTALEDLVSYHSDSRMSYTWYSESSDFTPGRLDFMIYSGSVMDVEKAYTIETASMSSTRLTKYNLSPGDSRISDHLPKVADFSLKMATPSGLPKNRHQHLNIYPNPVSDVVTVSMPVELINSRLRILDLAGKEKFTKQVSSNKVEISLKGLPAGLYIIEVAAEGGNLRRKLLKL